MWESRANGYQRQTLVETHDLAWAMALCHAMLYQDLFHPPLNTVRAALLMHPLQMRVVLMLQECGKSAALA